MVYCTKKFGLKFCCDAKELPVEEAKRKQPLRLFLKDNEDFLHLLHCINFNF